MSDIQSLIQKLKSKDPDKRFDACKELRMVSFHEQIPQEAIDALHIVATNDSNPNVAVAAQWALAIRTQTSNEKDIKQEKTVTNDSANWLLIGILVGLSPTFIFSLMLGMAYGLYLGFAGIPGGVLGAYIYKRSTLSAAGGAVTGALLGSFLWIFLFSTAQG